MKTILTGLAVISFSLGGWSQQFTYPTSGSAAATLVAPDGVKMVASLRSEGCVPGGSSSFVYSTSHVSTGAIYRNTKWAAGCRNSMDIIKLDFTSVNIRPLGIKFSIFDVDNGADSVSVHIFSAGVLVPYSYQLYSPTYVTASGADTSTSFYGSANNNSGLDDNTGRIDIATIGPLVRIDSINIYKHNNSDASGNPSQSFARFDWSASTVLPVKLVSFTANQQGSDLLLHWKVAQETGIHSYQVEYADENLAFRTLGNPVRANETILAENSYSTVAPVPLTKGQLFLRLASIGTDGKRAYSQIIRFKGEAGASILAYPTIFGTTLSVAVTAREAASCRIKLLGMDGRVVYESASKLTRGTNLIPVTVSSSLAKGSYLLVAELSNGTLVRQVVVKE